MRVIRWLTILWGVLASLACAPSGRESPLPFALPISYDVGKKPAALIAHDMNNDGFPDLLVPNTDHHNLYYFEGIGDGTFKDPLILDTGREPVGAAAADFDGDGIADIAVCNYGDNDVSIILGQKDGMFKRRPPIKLGQLRLPVAIGSGDFNGDRKADLVVTLRFDKLIILLGNGDATFKVANAYRAGGNPASLVMGDFNHDNFDDFAIAFNGVNADYIRIFMSKGDGTFDNPRRIVGGKQSTFITKGDINRDGQWDLVVTSPSVDSLTVFLGDGKGNFEPGEGFAAEKGPASIVVGDYNHDALPDLVVSNRRDASISVLEGKGDGTFIFPHFNYAVGAGPRAMVGADFNNDGLQDVALLLYEKSILEILIHKLAPNPSVES